MNNNKNSVMKYVGSAMTLGGAVMLGSGLMKDRSSIKKKVKRTAAKALNTVDGFINNMQNIIK